MVGWKKKTEECIRLLVTFRISENVFLTSKGVQAVHDSHCCLKIYDLAGFSKASQPVIETIRNVSPCPVGQNATTCFVGTASWNRPIHGVLKWLQVWVIRLVTKVLLRLGKWITVSLNQSWGAQWLRSRQHPHTKVLSKYAQSIHPESNSPFTVRLCLWSIVFYRHVRGAPPEKYTITLSNTRLPCKSDDTSASHPSGLAVQHPQYFDML